MSRLLLTKIIIILTLVAQSNFYGLMKETFTIGGLPFFDVPIIVMGLYFLWCLPDIRKSITMANIFVFIYLILTTLIILSMPFREDVSLVNASQTGRFYYLFLLSIVVSDNIELSGGTHFIRKVIYSTGMYMTVVALINFVFPEFIDAFLPGIRSGFGDMKGDTLRNYVGSILVVFVHMSFVLKLLSVLCNEDERKITDLLLVLLYFIGMYAVGARACLFSIVGASMCAYFFVANKLNSWGRFSGISQIRNVLTGFVILIVLNVLSGNIIFGLAESVVNDITGVSAKDNNTFQYREKRAMAYQIPQVMKSPIIGLGFIYKNSNAAKKYGFDSTVASAWRSLYCVDFGYGTMWVTFGIIGSAIILFFILRSLLFCIRLSKDKVAEEILTLPVILLAFMVCNYTWAMLVSSSGVLVMSFAVGITNHYVPIISKESEENI